MVFILALLAGLAWAQPADLAVTGARIYTLDPARPHASAMAVRDGKILAVADDVARHIGPATRVIDAKGAAVIPGLIDSHVHLRNFGESLELLELRALNSEQKIAELVGQAARERKPGEWIRGRGWDQNTFPDKQFPTAASLSAAAPHNPVYLTRVDGHAGWVNQKALESGDVNRATPDPPGGKILRDKDGRPTGILIDREQNLVRAHIPSSTAEQTRRYLLRAARECARLGLTSVHDAGTGAEELAAMRALNAERQFPVRVYAMIGGAGALWKQYLERGPETGDRLTVRSIKLVADGALGSRGAALLEPYSDDPGNTGLLITGREEIERVAREAVGRGFQVNTHAIGERWAEARVGPERVLGAYAWQRFLKLGVVVANGSDFPVEEPNPLWGFYAAVTRQDRQGSPPDGWFPGQRMSREEALKSWTLDGAYAAFEEKTKGSLEPGKLADFVVLSGDIMKIPPPEILKTRVTMTVLGGEVVYPE
ncbi:MAG: amidohydrolase [Candidatus Solibacter usitatus]|nr:amidohydrolase [Candidatus Solibacter usitatus]